MSTELDDLRDVAKTRLEELEKLNENYITAQQEKEKLKLEVCDNTYDSFIFCGEFCMISGERH